MKTVNHLFLVPLLTLMTFDGARGAPPAPKASPIAAPVTAPVSGTKLETAAFAAGCFWGTEEYFRKLPGVVSTRVGYEGGKGPAGYEDVSSGGTGHAETLELQFDPSKTTYRELLTQFWKMHDPTTKDRQGNDRGTQYRSAVFTQSADQKRTAEELKVKIEKSGAWKKPLMTEIAPASTFYPAEDYHQKYLVKHPGGYDNHFVRDLRFE